MIRTNQRVASQTSSRLRRRRDFWSDQFVWNREPRISIDPNGGSVQPTGIWWHSSVLLAKLISRLLRRSTSLTPGRIICRQWGRSLCCSLCCSALHILQLSADARMVSLRHFTSLYVFFFLNPISYISKAVSQLLCISWKLLSCTPGSWAPVDFASSVSMLVSRTGQLMSTGRTHTYKRSAYLACKC